MASTTGFYLHSCYYFRKDADSNYGFTCSFGPGPIAAVTAAAEIPHCPHVPEVLAQTYVPTDPVTGAAEILARTAVPEVLEITLVPEVFAVDAFGPVQCDLPDIFQPHIPNWTSQLWVGMTKAIIFKKDAPQWNILYQNPGDGYTALFRILTPAHSTLSRFPYLLISAPPTQIATETVAMYFQHYIDFMGFQGLLEENRSTLNLSSELDMFISGLTHSKQIFCIS